MPGVPELDGDIEPFEARADPAVHERYTLTRGGYFAAGTLAVLGFALVSGLVIALFDGGRSTLQNVVETMFTWAYLAGVFAALAAIVVGIPLTLIAHRLLTDVGEQGVHIAVFGAIGLIAALCVFAVFGLFAWNAALWLLILGAGTATALGRLIVGRFQGLSSSRADI